MISFKKNLNLLILTNIFILFIFIIGFIYLLKKEIGDENKYLITKSHFLCNTPIYQYYSSIPYLTNISSIREKIIKNTAHLYLPHIRTMAIRFVINCRGEVDGFSCEAFDENYIKKNVDEKSEEIIIDEIKKQTPMPIGFVNGKNVNVYFLLRFKIENGKIKDIF